MSKIIINDRITTVKTYFVIRLERGGKYDLQINEYYG